MRKAEVYYHDRLAGNLLEDENGYHFNYESSYVEDSDSKAISLTLPITDKVYTSRVLFPFFDGLIPEGWLLDITKKNWKIDTRDRMGLVMTVCEDCIGAVSIKPLIDE